MYTQIDAAERDQRHDHGQYDAHCLRHILAHNTTSEYCRGVHRVATGKGIASRCVDRIAVGNDPGVPYPRAIGAGCNLQGAVDQAVAAPTHHQVRAILLADAPIYDRQQYGRRR